jgi:hypothetical protein
MRTPVRNNCGGCAAPGRAAILEALALEPATLMLQAAWHTPARLLFKEMERFHHNLQARSVAGYRESMTSHRDATSPSA